MTTAKKSVSFIQYASCQTLVAYLLFSSAQGPFYPHLMDVLGLWFGDLIFFHWHSLGGTVNQDDPSSPGQE